MPNLLKRDNIEESVQEYDFLNDYKEEDRRTSHKNKKDETEDSEEKSEEKKETLKDKVEEKITREEAEAILDEARKQAEEILENAKKRAEEIKEEEAQKGYKSGHDEGYDNGYSEAVNKVNETVGAESEMFLNELRRIIEETSNKKEEILHQYLSDLRDVAISVGERVIHVSLKSSADIIERMILSATERLKTKEWVKVYISKADAEIMVEGGKDIIKALSDLSDHVKVISMEKEKQGTCIIEFPDEIIDASVSTQVENIKEILKNTGA